MLYLLDWRLSAGQGSVLRRSLNPRAGPRQVEALHPLQHRRHVRPPAGGMGRRANGKVPQAEV